MKVEIPLSAGYYSTLETTTKADDGKILLRKTYGERSGELSVKDAEQLIAAMERFDDIAGEIGVQTARPVGFSMTPHYLPGAIMLHEDVFHVGPDIQTILNGCSADDSAVLQLLVSTLEQHRKVFASGHPITLDAVLANFCLSDQGIVYIDKMPPRQKLPDGSYLAEIPQPPENSREIIEERHFTPVQSRTIYAQGLRSLATKGMSRHAPFYKEAIGKILGDEAYTYIDLSPSQREAVLSNPSPADIDTLRMLGWEAYHAGRASFDVAKKVHSLSHIHYGGILPQPEELQQAGRLLLTAQRVASYRAVSR